MVILNALFAWLTEAGYLAGNPLALARRRRALVGDVKDAVEAMPTATERERPRAARCRWLCTVLYLGGLRASEVTSTAMGGVLLPARCPGHRALVAGGER